MRTILALIGPKGAGKTYLGRLLEERLGVVFVDVEAVFRALPDPGRVGEGYDEVARQIAEHLHDAQAVSLELTGAAPEAKALLDHLETLAVLRKVRVLAPLDLCLERIAGRDAGVHLPTSEDVVERVHAISSALELDFDLTINAKDWNEAAVLRDIAAIL
ncbi:MAG: AAA family ATPase [Planctomycetota bacterium]|jgi:cytidylate kinase